MAHYPTGITSLPGADATDTQARLAQMLPAIDEHPVAATAPCRNPECGGPVDYLGRGKPPMYCSSACRARVATLRRLATEQLDLITRTLEEAAGMHGVPRDQLQERGNQLLVARPARLDPVQPSSIRQVIDPSVTAVAMATGHVDAPVRFTINHPASSRRYPLVESTPPTCESRSGSLGCCRLTFTRCRRGAT